MYSESTFWKVNTGPSNTHNDNLFWFRGLGWAHLFHDIAPVMNVQVLDDMGLIVQLLSCHGDVGMKKLNVKF